MPEASENAKRGISWREFAAAAPAMAELGLAILERFDFVFVATLRQDGTPRINPAECYVINGELALNMMRDSLKARDLLRDQRVGLHFPVTHREGDEGEFKVAGKVEHVTSDALRCAIADRIEIANDWRPPPTSVDFVVRLESAAWVAWRGEREMMRWSAERGIF